MISAASQTAAQEAKQRPATAPAEAAVEAVGLKPSQASAVQAIAKPKIQYDPEKLRANLKAAVDFLNKQMADSGRQLGFHVDEALNGPIVTVKDKKTGQTIRQIPSEAVVKVAHTFESLKGLLHNSVV